MKHDYYTINTDNNKTLYFDGDIYKPIAGVTLCNYGGLIVFNNIYDISEGLVNAFDFGGDYQNATHSTIRTDKNDRDYIIRNHTRYYLDEMNRF